MVVVAAIGTVGPVGSIALRSGWTVKSVGGRVHLVGAADSGVVVVCWDSGKVVAAASLPGKVRIGRKVRVGLTGSVWVVRKSRSSGRVGFALKVGNRGWSVIAAERIDSKDVVGRRKRGGKHGTGRTRLPAAPFGARRFFWRPHSGRIDGGSGCRG